MLAIRQSSLVSLGVLRYDKIIVYFAVRKMEMIVGTDANRHDRGIEKRAQTARSLANVA